MPPFCPFQLGFPLVRSWMSLARIGFGPVPYFLEGLLMAHVPF